MSLFNFFKHRKKENSNTEEGQNSVENEQKNENLSQTEAEKGPSGIPETTPEMTDATEEAPKVNPETTQDTEEAPKVNPETTQDTEEAPRVEKIDLNTIKEEKSSDLVDRVMEEILKIK